MRISDKDFRNWLLNFASGLGEIRNSKKTQEEREIVDQAIRCFLRTTQDSTPFWTKYPDISSRLGFEPATWDVALLEEFAERSGFQNQTPGY